jgi:arsenate reductase (glutaredoxin)
MREFTIYHNPDCGTSRNVLAMLRKSGIEPIVIEYLKTPPDRATLASLIASMGMTARGLLRVKGTPYGELGLDDPKWTDDELVGALVEHPILINRPIVVAPKGVRLCRPATPWDTAASSAMVTPHCCARSSCCRPIAVPASAAISCCC